MTNEMMMRAMICFLFLRNRKIPNVAIAGARTIRYGWATYERPMDAPARTGNRIPPLFPPYRTRYIPRNKNKRARGLENMVDTYGHMNVVRPNINARTKPIFPEPNSSLPIANSTTPRAAIIMEFR